MMRASPIALCTFAALLCMACVGQVEMRIEPNQPIWVSLPNATQEPSSWAIQPGTPEHARFAAWVKSNQSGWSTYPATTPGGGLLVSSGEWRLQFIADGVIACVIGRTCVHKAISSTEYQFLMHARPKPVA